MRIEELIDYKITLITISLTIFYLFITSNNNIILKKNIDKN